MFSITGTLVGRMLHGCSYTDIKTYLVELLDEAGQHEHGRIHSKAGCRFLIMCWFEFATRIPARCRFKD